MELNKYIEHTLLRADATKEEIIKLCEEAKKYHFASVCVAPYYISLAKEQLNETYIEISTIVGYPLGNATTSTKEFEAIEASNLGATEIEFVININALKNNELDYVKKEIETIRDAVDGKTIKVIIETSYLTKEEIKIATEICNETFVNFIKTSSILNETDIEDVKIINKYKSELLEISVSKNKMTLSEIDNFIDQGVTSLSITNGVEIMNEEEI